MGNASILSEFKEPNGGLETSYTLLKTDSSAERFTQFLTYFVVMTS